MLVGNKANLCHLHAISTEDGQAFTEKEKTYFMETSALESMNVENSFGDKDDVSAVKNVRCCSV
ncbi:RAS-related protein raba1g [Phtheirospermum japonicum]|uniref:RAS-related protein raba1g n=1 Tax=Phtheirospermum japonicum TaxID=374723 RepID=A0A830C1L6_9LAMI|nr:RAS-related protein raba1g [Phtheirospermum japonicum]